MEWLSTVNSGLFTAGFVPCKLSFLCIFPNTRLVCHTTPIAYNSLKLFYFPFNLTQVKICYCHLRRYIMNKKQFVIFSDAFWGKFIVFLKRREKDKLYSVLLQNIQKSNIKIYTCQWKGSLQHHLAMMMMIIMMMIVVSSGTIISSLYITLILTKQTYEIVLLWRWRKP